MPNEPVGIRMELKPGCAAEYKRRHDRIWPELEDLLRQSGLHDYSIFLAPDEVSLFAIMRRRAGFSEQTLPSHPLMRRWWDHMADLMVVDDNNRPVEWPMRQVFRLADSGPGKDGSDD